MNKGLKMCDECDYFISVEEAYQLGREHAIEEFAHRIESCTLLPHDVYGKIYKIAGEMKEQKK